MLENIVMIPTKNLEFDKNNPRFYSLEKNINILNEMLDKEGVQDLMLSIGQKGYFKGEPLLVVQDGQDTYTVVEGNRRLTAVKLLNGELTAPENKKRSIENIILNINETPPVELPCVIYQNRKDILRYLGYRHITGIQEWDSLSKARYLKQLQIDFYQDKDNFEQLKLLAKDIGSRADYVGQLLTALNLYNIAEKKFFEELNLSHYNVSFSFITTAIGYEKITKWLGLENKQDIVMKNLNLYNLKLLIAWMFKIDQQGNTILGESRNISLLATIVSSEDALEKLKETGNINEAYLYTSGAEEALDNILNDIFKRLRNAWNMLINIKKYSLYKEISEKNFDFSKKIRDYIRDKADNE